MLTTVLLIFRPVISTKFYDITSLEFIIGGENVTSSFNCNTAYAKKIQGNKIKPGGSESAKFKSRRFLRKKTKKKLRIF